MSKKVGARRRSKPSENSSTWEFTPQTAALAGLTQKRIVEAAVAIADAEGLAAVSIRRVALHLHSSAMALYHHVPSKRDLLNLMLDATYLEFEFPAENIRDWRDAMVHVAWEGRRGLMRHPWTRVLHTESPEYGPECIRIFDSILTQFANFGIDNLSAHHVLGALFVFTIGFASLEQPTWEAPGSDKERAEVEEGNVQQPNFAKSIVTSGQFPNVARFVAEGAAIPNDEAFERALGWMLNGIAADLQLPMPS